MIEVLEPPRETEANPRAETSAEYLRLRLLRVIQHLLRQAADALGSADALVEQFPFLQYYVDELRLTIRRPPWEEAAETVWPALLENALGPDAAEPPLLRLARLARLDPLACDLWLVTGLTEEDPRFAGVFDAVQPGLPSGRPNLSLLQAWWNPEAQPDAARHRLRRLLQLGLVQVLNADAPRSGWSCQAHPVLWDALRDEGPDVPLPGLRLQRAEALPALEELILPPALTAEVQGLTQLLREGEPLTVVLRGPRHNGRSTLAGALARELGCGLLRLTSSCRPEDERARLAGPLAALSGAIPLWQVETGPGETLELPPLDGYAGPVFVVLGRKGGLASPGHALTLELGLPERATRRELWRAALPELAPDVLDTAAAQDRVTSGNVFRLARQAAAYARLAGDPNVSALHLQRARRSVNRAALDQIATPLPATGDWQDLAVSATVARELETLATRCRFREALPAALGPRLAGRMNPGVRALFSGPSGTGKTLAARVLAATAGRDLYRLDLAAVVSKYIGETEKNLERVFAGAEELDVVLLLDEGDALLTQRTQVATSNDRYANLETNFLLQRIEDFEGILLVTTNAADRIDSAFLRRMDVIVEFCAPSPEERWHLWQAHLPPGHAVPEALLHELTARCPLSGGQVRNTLLHAALLALDEQQPVGARHVIAAVQREYEKFGAACPLRGNV